MMIVLYLFSLLYHFLLLHTISLDMGYQNMVRLGIGGVIVFGATAIARYRISRRNSARKHYDNTLAQLEKAGRQNADFMSNVSHEFRTPINMVIGISEVTLEKNISPEILEDIRSIQMAGKRLSNQINNILDYTEIVEGTLTAAKEEYMITSLLNDVITTIAMQNSRQQLEIVFDMNPRMPTVLIGDAEKISHVLKILVENSIKFTEEGGIDICIDYRKESYGINLIIDIYDTGIGMTDSQITQMCNDFYQAESGSDRYASGLGLPIARGLLHAMGGFIHFDSKSQEGLQTHIVIPQEVKDHTPSMSISNVESICVACYFRTEKYSCDEVRGYYDKMILHMIEGLNIKGYQTHNFDGLLKLLKHHKVTHLFIAQMEYEENSSYYENLPKDIQVVIIANKDFSLHSNSRLLVLRKPFFALSVVNLLNGEAKENRFEEAQAAGRRPFSCVDVHVLVVDDEAMNLLVAKGVLGSYGIQVDTCLSGREAITRCQTNTYDIVFLDHMMPGFDGVETLRQIREINNGIYQDLPIIALTANTISGAREMFRYEGFTEFIPKPIERAVLERVLRKCLPKNSIQYHTAFLNSNYVHTEKDISENFPSNKQIPEETGSDSPLLSLNDLAQYGINVQLGLDYCSGEKDFYMEMLETFLSQYAEKKEEIVSLYEAADWANYAIKVHALKSTSLTIGAEQLSECAKALEKAGKEEDADYIQENHALLLELYDKICKTIDKI